MGAEGSDVAVFAGGGVCWVVVGAGGAGWGFGRATGGGIFEMSSTVRSGIALKASR